MAWSRGRLVRIDPNRQPPAFESGGDRPGCPRDGGSDLADLPGTTGSTTTGIEDACEPLLPISGERTVVFPVHHSVHHDSPYLARSHPFVTAQAQQSKGRVPRGFRPSDGGFEVARPG